MTRKSCYTETVSSTRRLRNVTVTLEEDVAQWARIEAARQDTSVSRLLGALLKERMSAHDDYEKVMRRPSVANLSAQRRPLSDARGGSRSKI